MADQHRRRYARHANVDFLIAFGLALFGNPFEFGFEVRLRELRVFAEDHLTKAFLGKRGNSMGRPGR
ncbi:MAG: hypothetical protein ACNA7O_18590 [Rhodobacterales bacterium]